MHGKWFPVVSALKPSFRKPRFLPAHLETAMCQLVRLFRWPNGCLLSCNWVQLQQASESGLLVWGVLARSRKVGRSTVGRHLDQAPLGGFCLQLSALELSDSQHESKIGGGSFSMEPWCMGLDLTDVAHGKMVDKLPCFGGVGWLMGEGILLTTWCVVH